MRTISMKYFSFLEYFFNEIILSFFFFRNYWCQLTRSLISYKNFFKFLRISNDISIGFRKCSHTGILLLFVFIKNDCSSFLLPDFISCLTQIFRGWSFHTHFFTLFQTVELWLQKYKNIEGQRFVKNVIKWSSWCCFVQKSWISIIKCI